MKKSSLFRAFTKNSYALRYIVNMIHFFDIFRIDFSALGSYLLRPFLPIYDTYDIEFFYKLDACDDLLCKKWEKPEPARILSYASYTVH
jgi:hypothetical protein